jgi:hypothetical protein
MADVSPCINPDELRVPLLLDDEEEEEEDPVGGKLHP